MTATEGDGVAGETEVLAQINERLRSISRKMDRKFVRNATVMALGVVLVVVAIVTARQSSDNLAHYKRQAQAARVGACQQYNRHEGQQAQIEIGESHDQINLFVAAAASRPGSDPTKIAAFVDDYNMKHDRKIHKVHAEVLRDCSARGIDRFLEGTK